jgi:hypothetical protein
LTAGAALIPLPGLPFGISPLSRIVRAKDSGQRQRVKFGGRRSTAPARKQRAFGVHAFDLQHPELGRDPAWR